MADTLGDLIISLKGTRTYSQLAADCGGNLTPGRIQQMATRPQVAFPGPETINGLARGLRVNPGTVLDACAHTLGLDVDRSAPRLAELMPEGVKGLDEGQINAVLAVIQAFIAGNSAGKPV